MEDIIIRDEKNFGEKKKRILKAGVGKFHVLADFDLTLTKANIDGIKTQSIMKYLRNGNYLTSDYAKKANELFDRYHPYEIDSRISHEEKMAKMKEWWTTHFKLLIDSGLDKKTLDRFVQDVKLEFREGTKEFLEFVELNPVSFSISVYLIFFDNIFAAFHLFPNSITIIISKKFYENDEYNCFLEGTKEFLEFLDKHNIPLMIISSSGLGSVIPMYLKREGMLYDNISVVANLFEFNEKGIVTKVKEPIIHSFNKSEVTLNHLPIYRELLKRKNVLLLGDSLGDLGMIEGFDYENLLTIGFLNENVENNLETYKKKFDVVIPNDGSFEFVNDFVKGFEK